MEYFCHLCREWLDTVNCESHFEGAHNSKNMTLQNLKARMEQWGGLDMREEATESPESEQTQKNWMYRDEGDGNGTFVTNNFQHKLR